MEYKDQLLVGPTRWVERGPIWGRKHQLAMQLMFTGFLSLFTPVSPFFSLYLPDPVISHPRITEIVSRVSKRKLGHHMQALMF